MGSSDENLITAAREARHLAYAPYSNYKVGAAVRAKDGRVFSGCNIENASYGLSLCAERIAAFAAVAAGAREIEAVAVVTEDGGTPCGACRQVLMEFAPRDGSPMTVLLTALNPPPGAPPGQVRATTLDALLPEAFRLDVTQQ